VTYKGDHGFKICDEDRILLLSTRNQDPQVKDKILKLFQGVDWENLTQKASQHRLTQLLYWNLKGFPEEVPGTILNDLKKSFDVNVRRNLFLFGELLKILKLLESANINAVPYKGPVLAIRAYGNISLRHFDDLDIFVDRENVLKVKEILISKGYKPQFELNGFMQRRFLRSQREYKFFNPETNVHVEVHWQFQGVSFSLSGDPKFLEDFERVKLNNKEVLSLKPENMLLVFCIHITGHHWERLSWICDISMLVKSHEMDWDYLKEKSGELGIERVLKVNMALAVDLFDLELPDTVLEDLKSDEVQDLVFKVEKRIFSSDPENIFQMAVLRLKIRENMLDRVKDLFKTLFAPTNKEWDESSPKLLLPPASYIVRFLNVLRKNY
jgi:hypothetical protein